MIDFNTVNVGKMIITAKGQDLILNLKAAVDSPMPMDLAPRSMPLTEPPPWFESRDTYFFI